MRPLRGPLILFCLALAMPFALRGQDCAGFHTRTCPIPDFTYYYDQQSVSFSLAVGQQAQVSIIVFEMSDYYISVCAHRKFTTLQLRILEDSPQRQLLYDSASEDFLDHVKFTNDRTKRVILEVSVPAQGNDATDPRERCVGVLIAKRIRVTPP